MAATLEEIRARIERAATPVGSIEDTAGPYTPTPEYSNDRFSAIVSRIEEAAGAGQEKQAPAPIVPEQPKKSRFETIRENIEAVAGAWAQGEQDKARGLGDVLGTSWGDVEAARLRAQSAVKSSVAPWFSDVHTNELLKAGSELRLPDPEVLATPSGTISEGIAASAQSDIERAKAMPGLTAMAEPLGLTSEAVGGLLGALPAFAVLGGLTSAELAAVNAGKYGPQLSSAYQKLAASEQGRQVLGYLQSALTFSEFDAVSGGSPAKGAALGTIYHWAGSVPGTIPKAIAVATAALGTGSSVPEAIAFALAGGRFKSDKKTKAEPGDAYAVPASEYPTTGPDPRLGDSYVSKDPFSRPAQTARPPAGVQPAWAPVDNWLARGEKPPEAAGAPVGAKAAEPIPTPSQAPERPPEATVEPRIQQGAPSEPRKTRPANDLVRMVTENAPDDSPLTARDALDMWADERATGDKDVSDAARAILGAAEKYSPESLGEINPLAMRSLAKSVMENASNAKKGRGEAGAGSAPEGALGREAGEVRLRDNEQAGNAAQEGKGAPREEAPGVEAELPKIEPPVTEAPKKKIFKKASVDKALTPVTSKDQTRDSLQGIFYDKKNGTAVATDGTILAMLPDTSGKEGTFRAREKRENVKGGPLGKQVTGKVGDKIDSAFPDYKSILEGAKGRYEITDLDIENIRAAAEEIVKSKDKKVLVLKSGGEEITLDAEKFSRLVKALKTGGAGELRMSYDAPLSPVIIKDASNPKIMGLIMPMRSDISLPKQKFGFKVADTKRTSEKPLRPATKKKPPEAEAQKAEENVGNAASKKLFKSDLEREAEKTAAELVRSEARLEAAQIRLRHKKDDPRSIAEIGERTQERNDLKRKLEELESDIERFGPSPIGRQEASAAVSKAYKRMKAAESRLRSAEQVSNLDTMTPSEKRRFLDNKYNRELKKKIEDLEDAYNKARKDHGDAERIYKLTLRNPKAPKGEASTGGYAPTETERARQIPKGKEPPKQEPPKQEGLPPEEEPGKRETETFRRIAMPELVDFFRSVMKATPSVKRAISRNLGTLGMFVHKDGKRGTGRILLRADIFKDAESAAKTFAHEIGHWLGWLGKEGAARTLKRGNILGHLAGLENFKKHMVYASEKMRGAGEMLGGLTEKDIDRLKKEARDRAKQEAGGQREEIGVTPGDILRIWNDNSARKALPELYKFVAKMSREEKVAVIKQAMKGIVDQTILDHMKRGESGGYATLGKREREIFQKAMDVEIRKRYGFTLEEIQKELKDLTMWWRPFDSTADPGYTSYRHRPTELYADAMSVLIHSPSEAQKRAPRFYEAFQAFLGERPEVAEGWNKYQELAKNRDALYESRKERELEMIKEGREARIEADERAVKDKEAHMVSLKEQLMSGLWDDKHGILKHIRKAEKKGGPLGEMARELRATIESIPYLSAKAAAMFERVKLAFPGIKDGTYTSTDLDRFAMHMRNVYGDRSDKANPGGFQWEQSKEQLDGMRREWGDAKYNAVLEGFFKWRELRENMITSFVEKGIVSRETGDKMLSNKWYATFQVTGYMKQQFGSWVSSKVKRQYGTFENVGGAFESTVLKDLAMLHAAEVNAAKRDTVDFLLRSGVDLKKAEPDRRTGVPKEAIFAGRGKYEDTLSFLRDGKAEHWYMDKRIVEALERDPAGFNPIAEKAQKYTAPLKKILVSLNPKWMLMNMPRDFLSTVMNVPQITGPRDAARLAMLYGKAWKEVTQAVKEGRPNEHFISMLEDGKLPVYRMFDSESKLTSDMEAYQNLAESLRVKNFSPASHLEALNKRGWWPKLRDNLDEWGRRSELLSKVAADLYLDKYSDIGHVEQEHIIRTAAGTPDVYRRGRWQQFTNNVFMFSNVNKEGWRTTYSAARENPTNFIYKQLLFNLGPKFAIYLAARGAFGEETKKTMAMIPEYEKENYHIIPLFHDGKGAWYLRLPTDFNGQFFGRIAWQLANPENWQSGDIGSTLVKSVVEAQPYRPGPYLKAAGESLSAATGINPPDTFTGGTAFPKYQFDSGWKNRLAAVMMRNYNTLGLRNIVDLKRVLDPEKIANIQSLDDIKDPWNDRTTMMNKIAGIFGISAMPGAFVKYSDFGIMEEINQRKQESVLKRAENRQEVKYLFRDKSKKTAEQYREAREKGLIPSNRTYAAFSKDKLRYYASKDRNPIINFLASPSNSKEAKVDALRTAKANMSKEEYSKLYNRAMRYGVIPEQFQ